MPFPLEVGHKFSCYALANVGLARGPHAPINLGGGLWVLFEPPFVLDGAWREWLGTIQSERLERTNLVFLAHAASLVPEILDRENGNLSSTARSLFYALLLVETFRHDGGIALSGANVGGEVRLRQVSQLQKHYAPRGFSTAVVTRGLLMEAHTVAEGMRLVHSYPGTYERLRRGFHSFVSGVQEYYGDERLHQFVRAVEAVVKPAQGRTRRQFVHRCQLFAGGGSRVVNLLGELYDLRSCAEHLNNFSAPLSHHRRNTHELIGVQRAFQAQALASCVYKRIFSDANLHAALATDSAIDAFWSLPPERRSAVWGTHVDLEAITAARFLGV